MSDRMRQSVQKTLDGSVAMSHLRIVASGSVLCQFILVGARWSLRTRDRIIAAVRLESSAAEQQRIGERLAVVVAGSRVVGAWSAMVDALPAAFQDARLTNSLRSLSNLDLETRVRMAASVAVIAALTHIIVLAVVGVPVQALGWGVRAAVIAAGLLVAWHPASIAAAWRARRTGASG